MTDQRPTRAEALEANHAAFIAARNDITDAWRDADRRAYAAYLAEMKRIEAEYAIDAALNAAHDKGGM